MKSNCDFCGKLLETVPGISSFKQRASTKKLSTSMFGMFLCKPLTRGQL